MSIADSVLRTLVGYYIDYQRILSILIGSLLAGYLTVILRTQVVYERIREFETFGKIC